MVDNMQAQSVSNTRIKKSPKKGEISFWNLAHNLSKKTEGQRIEVIHEGFDSTWLVAISKTFHLTRPALSTIVHLSASTLERRLKNRSQLDPIASERLDRIAQIAVLAESIFEDEQVATSWMAANNDALGGKTPLSLCNTELGARQVRRVLHAIEWGGVA